MDRVDPIRASPRERRLSAVVGVADTRVHRETPEEAAERRRRQHEERERQQARRAWADAQLKALREPGYVSEEDSDDGHAHVDISV